MEYYFVSKTPTAGFMGQLTIKTIREWLLAGKINEDYVATPTMGYSYTDIFNNHEVIWSTVGELLKGVPAEIFEEPITNNLAPANESGTFALGLRVVGWIYFVLSIIGAIVLFSNVSRNIYNSYSGTFTEVMNYNFLVFGIAALLQALITLMIMIGIAKALDKLDRIN